MLLVLNFNMEIVSKSAERIPDILCQIKSLKSVFPWVLLHLTSYNDEFGRLQFKWEKKKYEQYNLQDSI